MAEQKRAVNLLVLYSDKEIEMFRPFLLFLEILKKNERIDRLDLLPLEISKGDLTSSSQIILFLLSDKTLESPYSQEQFIYASKLHREGLVILIPVQFQKPMSTKSSWELNRDFQSLWRLPYDNPVNEYKNLDEAYQSILFSIFNTIEYYLSTTPINRRAINNILYEVSFAGSTKIDISNFALTVIPDPVFGMTWLNELILGVEKPVATLDEMKKSGSDREYNQLAEIPAQIKLLKNLKTLNLGFNRVEKIKNLEELSNLETLILRGNKLQKVQNLKSLTKLQNLYLQDNKIAVIENLEGLLALKILHLDGNKITSLDLNYLWFVQTLSLNNNPIHTILPSHDPSEITFLSLSGNSIKNIEGISSLAKLESLDLFDNQIEDITPLKELSNLTYLRLSTNNIKDISPLKNLDKLRTIRLSENKIEDLSPLFGHIESGLTFVNHVSPAEGEISVASNPVTTPDITYITSGRESQLAYIKSIQDQLVFSPSNILKIILLGNSNSGKTTFRKYLVNDPDYKKQDTTPRLEVETLEWPVNGQPGPLTLKILDFGGQEYYHGTYPLFFSLETLYIVLWTAGENKYEQKKSRETIKADNGTELPIMNEDFDVSYWLNSIEIITRDKNSYLDEIRKNKGMNTAEYLPGGVEKTAVQVERENALQKKRARSEKEIPVLLIQNKVDIDGVVYEDIKNFSTVFERFGIDTLSLSMYENNRLEFMKSMLHQKIMETNAHLRKVPDKWTNIKKKLVDKFLAIKIISYQEFVDVARTEFRADKYNDEYLVGIAKYFHSTHDLIYFGDIAGGVIVVDTNWFINTIYELVSGKTSVQYKGVLTRERLNSITEKEFTRSDVLIEILRQKRILFDLPEGEQPGNENAYILPQMLPMPEYGADKLLYESFEPANVVVQFKYHLHRILVQALYGLLAKEKEITSKFIYKNGVIVKKDKAMLFIYINQEKKRIELRTTKSSAENNTLTKHIIFSVLTDTTIVFKDPDTGIEKYTVFNLLPLGQDKPYLAIRPGKSEIFVPIGDIERVAQDISTNKKIATISYENNFYDLVDFAPYTYMMKQLVKMPKRIFISYSHKDTEVFNVFISHFNNLKNEGLISAWHDQMLLAGDKWDSKILAELRNADIVIFLISQDFINSRYIQEKEFREAYESAKKTIPIKIRSCEYLVFTNEQYVNKGLPLLPSNDIEGGIVSVINEIRKTIEGMDGSTTNVPQNGQDIAPVQQTDSVPGE